MSLSKQKGNFELDEIAINNFREYLRIPSVHPHVNYESCVKFLENQAKGLELPYDVFEHIPLKPIVIITWIGQEPHLPSILLNSHMDVVPAIEEKWTHDPFGAEIDALGNIYARGAQDMKSVGIQYLEAIRRLRNESVVLKRTIHLSFMPDEEVGGILGMKEFVKTDDFKNLNVGCSLDEGLASPNEQFVLCYGERCVWRMEFHCTGQSGHGSLFLENTPGKKVSYLLQKFFEFRDQEEQKLKDDPSLLIGDVTTINLTRLNGGVQSNVVPDEFIFAIDSRIPLTLDLIKWEEMLHQWMEEAGGGCWINYEQKQPQVPATNLDDSNPYWVAFKAATDELNLKLRPQIFGAATDSRYIRELGIPALGFSPMNNTPLLLHDHDEFVNKDTFLKGINIYKKVITNMGNINEQIF